MSGKGLSRRGNSIRRPRTEAERAKDRAVNRAIASAGDRSGPIIVRIEARSRSEAPPKATRPESQNRNSGARKDAANSALADALIAAGVKVPAKPTTANEPQERKAKPAEKTQQAEKAPSAPKSKAKSRPKPLTKKPKAKKPTKTPAEVEAEGVQRQQRKLLAELRRLAANDETTRTPHDLRWQQKQQEIAALIEDIQRASFAVLAAAWKRHVELADYIEETGRNRERLATYTKLVRAIESEWGRRARLSYSIDEYFDWPSTRAGQKGKGVAAVEWAEEGFLSYLGYHVGESSKLTDRQRRAILRRTFAMILPPLESPDYVKSWGAPSSPARLKKMADSLASFARSAKWRSASNFSLAISQWEADLAMLREEFYVAKFGFGWPVI